MNGRRWQQSLIHPNCAKKAQIEHELHPRSNLLLVPTVKGKKGEKGKQKK
jgi:hypothetical protein